MLVNEAIAAAKTFFQKAFAEERVSEPRLEEVEFDDVDAAWLITVSSLFPSQADRRTKLSGASQPERTYKTVRIDDAGGRLPSIKIRQLHGEA